MARPFRFSLERVLEVRRQQEEQAQIELALAESRLMEWQARTERLAGELEEAGNELAGRRELTARELWLWRGYRERILLDLQTAERALQESRAKVNACRQEALERSKERKKLEKLKEKQALEHNHREAVKDQQVLDEMATLRYTKRSV